MIDCERMHWYAINIVVMYGPGESRALLPAPAVRCAAAYTRPALIKPAVGPGQPGPASAGPGASKAT